MYALFIKLSRLYGLADSEYTNRLSAYCCTVFIAIRQLFFQMISPTRISLSEYERLIVALGVAFLRNLLTAMSVVTMVFRSVSR